MPPEKSKTEFEKRQISASIVLNYSEKATTAKVKVS